MAVSAAASAAGLAATTGAKRPVGFCWPVAVALALGISAAGADDGRPDPMRPSGAAPSGAPSAGERAAPSASGSGAGGLKLQSVLIGSGGAQAAVISGRLLAVGDRLGDARLLRLTERSAVLAGPRGQTTLLLLPGVDKQDAARAGAPGRAAAPATPAIPATRAATAATAGPRLSSVTETAP